MAAYAFSRTYLELYYIGEVDGMRDESSRQPSRVQLGSIRSRWGERRGDTVCDGGGGRRGESGAEMWRKASTLKLLNQFIPRQFRGTKIIICKLK